MLTCQLLAFSRPQVVQPHVLCVNGVVTKIAKMLQPLIGEDMALTTSLLAEDKELVRVSIRSRSR